MYPQTMQEATLILEEIQTLIHLFGTSLGVNFKRNSLNPQDFPRFQSLSSEWIQLIHQQTSQQAYQNLLASLFVDLEVTPKNTPPPQEFTLDQLLNIQVFLVNIADSTKELNHYFTQDLPQIIYDALEEEDWYTIDIIVLQLALMEHIELAEYLLSIANTIETTPLLAASYLSDEIYYNGLDSKYPQFSQQIIRYLRTQIFSQLKSYLELSKQDLGEVWYLRQTVRRATQIGLPIDEHTLYKIETAISLFHDNGYPAHSSELINPVSRAGINNQLFLFVSQQGYMPDTTATITYTIDNQQNNTGLCLITQNY